MSNSIAFWTFGRQSTGRAQESLRNSDCRGVGSPSAASGEQECVAEFAFFVRLGDALYYCFVHRVFGKTGLGSANKTKTKHSSEGTEARFGRKEPQNADHRRGQPNRAPTPASGQAVRAQAWPIRTVLAVGRGFAFA